MFDRKFMQGQVALLIGIVSMLVWTSQAAIPFAFLCFVVGIYLLLAAVTKHHHDLPNH